MRIAIVGAEGQVGKEVAELGQNQGHVIFPFSKAELDITCLIQTEEKITACAPDILINAAAYTAVDKAEQESNLAFAINRDGVKNLAHCCKKLNIPLLHISTDYIFAGNNTKPYKEDELAAPINIYGKSKWEGEEILRETLPQHIILRVSWVFGRYGHNFVKTILRLATQKKELSIVSDQIGSPTSATSIAATLLTLIDNISLGKILWGTYHFSSEPIVSWYEFAEKIIDYAKPYTALQIEKINAIKTSDYPTPAQRPKYSVLDMNKLKSVYNIYPGNWEKDLPLIIKQIVNTNNETLYS